MTQICHLRRLIRPLLPLHCSLGGCLYLGGKGWDWTCFNTQIALYGNVSFIYGLCICDAFAVAVQLRISYRLSLALVFCP
jgi:hypothetical protein